MRIRTLGHIGCAMLVLAGCGRFGGDSDSSWNPFRWFGGGSNQPTTLEPEGGYPTTTTDGRLGLAHITAARWEPLYEGRLLVVDAIPATKGWWNVALVTEVPMPRGRVRADATGTLRLRLVGNPPAKGTAAASSPANPTSDTITTAMTISNEALAGVDEVIITGGGNSVTLRK
ncbi:MAG TPA: hypothetical protein VNQ78_20655 [Paracoccus sp. (in: a-proteobacteria)]|uniref:hypothetical protein n=1 Tax=Paracoccus sp. TaxID=267 RepID=UPI002C1F6034|nr:hypothetical protein [Paracoccus sp. (in: a-proteobacteria)]HWL59069.1 hypothetical protein [Paracoccus sp. (in: a-proteobacteria)]